MKWHSSTFTKNMLSILMTKRSFMINIRKKEICSSTYRSIIPNYIPYQQDLIIYPPLTFLLKTWVNTTELFFFLYKFQLFLMMFLLTLVPLVNIESGGNRPIISFFNFALLFIKKLNIFIYLYISWIWYIFNVQINRKLLRV